MSGSICFDYRARSWYISIYIPKRFKDNGPKTFRNFEGQSFGCTIPIADGMKDLPEKIKRRCRGYLWAEKCLTFIRTDIEKGSFRIDKYRGKQAETVSYLQEWLESQSLMPGGYKTYKAHVDNHLVPWFKDHPFALNQIELDVVTALLRDLQVKGLSPKYVWNIVNTLHACLNFAYRSNRLERMPSFPRKGEYKLVQKPVRWLPEDRQTAIINAIGPEHQPIFWWLKYHYRRPGEAMALRKEDYDKDNDCFYIRRGVSARKVVERTKTGAAHIVPRNDNFTQWPENKDFRARSSCYLFTCLSSRSPGYRYTDTIMHRIWKDACKKTGESIDMYSGLKHSSCTQYLMAGNSKDELKLLTDHADIRSLDHYTGAILERKRAAMGKVVGIKYLRKTYAEEK